MTSARIEDKHTQINCISITSNEYIDNKIKSTPFTIFQKKKKNIYTYKSNKTCIVFNTENYTMLRKVIKDRSFSGLILQVKIQIYKRKRTLFHKSRPRMTSLFSPGHGPSQTLQPSISRSPPNTEDAPTRTPGRRLGFHHTCWFPPEFHECRGTHGDSNKSLSLFLSVQVCNH